MRTALFLALCLFLGACDTAADPPRFDPPPSTTISVAYRIEATATYAATSVDQIRYTDAEGEVVTLGAASLPWTTLVLAPRATDRIFSLEGVLTASSEATGMRATIVLDGELVSQGVVTGEPGGPTQTRRATASFRHQP